MEASRHEAASRSHFPANALLRQWTCFLSASLFSVQNLRFFFARAGVAPLRALALPLYSPKRVYGVARLLPEKGIRHCPFEDGIAEPLPGS
jgi:hypothetical protein